MIGKSGLPPLVANMVYSVSNVDTEINTWSNVPIGVASSDRYVVVTYSGTDWSNWGSYLYGIELNGAPLTDVYGYFDQSTLNGTYMAYRNVPSGTTATIHLDDLNNTRLFSDSVLTVYTIYTGGPSLVVGNTFYNRTTIFSVNETLFGVQAGDVIISSFATGSAGNAVSISGANLVIDYQDDVDNVTAAGSASNSSPIVSNSNYSVTFTLNNQSTTGRGAAAFRRV